MTTAAQIWRLSGSLLLNQQKTYAHVVLLCGEKLLDQQATTVRASSRFTKYLTSFKHL